MKGMVKLLDPSHPIRAHRRAILRCALLGMALSTSVFQGRAFAAPTSAPAATGPTTQPADTSAESERPLRRPAPDNFLRMQRQRRDTARNSYNAVGVGGTYRLDALLQFRMEKGMFDIQTSAIPVGAQTRIKVEGSNAIWLAYRQPQNVVIGVPGGAMALNPVVATTITRLDPDVKTDDEVWSTFVNISGNTTWVMGESVSGRVNLNETNGQITFNVMQWTTGLGGNIQAGVLLNTRSGSIGQLRATHPEEFRKYLLPMLSKLSDLEWLHPGAADVYTVFAEIPADEGLKSKVQALLPDLDSDAFPVRDAASTRLAALGPAGVLAALRMDWSPLSEEQRGRLLEVINEHHHREFPSLAAARKDLDFLADCLEYDDPAVRAASRAVIEQVLGQPVNFDVRLAGDARATAVDAIRSQISQAATLPSTQPATAPAERPVD